MSYNRDNRFHFEFTKEFKNATVKSVELVDGSFDKGDRHIDWKYYKLCILEEKTANPVYVIDNDTEEGKYKNGITGTFIVKAEFTNGEREHLYSAKLRVLNFRRFRQR